MCMTGYEVKLHKETLNIYHWPMSLLPCLCKLCALSNCHACLELFFFLIFFWITSNGALMSLEI